MGVFLLWMLSRLPSSVSPVLNELQGPFWSKNTRQNELFHLSFWSLISVELEGTAHIQLHFYIFSDFIKTFLHWKIYISGSKWAKRSVLICEYSVDSALSYAFLITQVRWVWGKLWSLIQLIFWVFLILFSTQRFQKIIRILAHG